MINKLDFNIIQTPMTGDLSDGWHQNVIHVFKFQRMEFWIIFIYYKIQKLKNTCWKNE